MKTFTLIGDSGKADAIIIDQPVPLRAFYALNGMIGEKFLNHHDLAKRWGAHQVLAEADWARAQRKRKPMLKPKGIRMALLED